MKALAKGKKASTRTSVARSHSLLTAWRTPARTALTRRSAGKLSTAFRGFRHQINAAMITALLAAKIQKGTAIPSSAITRPPSAGPAARPRLKPTPFKAVALSRSCLGTRTGIVAPQAGEVSAPPTASRKVVVSRSAGVARSSDTMPAKITEIARIASSTAISSRRESITSARAPAGRVNRNRGKLTATWTSDTVIGLASTLVISQPDAVSNMAVPTFDRTLAVQMTVKATEPKAPRREGAGRVGAAALSGFALKLVSSTQRHRTSNALFRPSVNVNHSAIRAAAQPNSELARSLMTPSSFSSPPASWLATRASSTPASFMARRADGGAI